MKSDEIGKYLPAGKITTDWQLAVVPVNEWLIDWKQMHALAVCFEGALYDTGAFQGTVFITDMAFTKEKPSANTLNIPNPDAKPAS